MAVKDNPGFRFLHTAHNTAYTLFLYSRTKLPTCSLSGFGTGGLRRQASDTSHAQNSTEGWQHATATPLKQTTSRNKTSHGVFVVRCMCLNVAYLIYIDIFQRLRFTRVHAVLL